MYLFLAGVLLMSSTQAIRLKCKPYLQNVTDTEVTIVWTTDRPSVGWVELAPDDNSHFYSKERPRYWNSRDGIKQVDSVHVVRLSGLKPGVRYRYRVYSQEVLDRYSYKVTYGDVAATDVYGREPYSFVTADPSAQSVSFAMVNDIHENNQMLEQLIKRCDPKKTDFYLFNGDMVSQSRSEKTYFDGFMNTAIRLFASEVPMYYTRGNHETRGVFAANFHRYFSPRKPHIYYTFRRGPVFFVILDTGEDKPDSDLEYAGITDYDYYRTEQARWLEQVLQSEAYRTAPFRVVVAHVPPIGGWHGNIEVQEKFVSLLSKAKPDLMLCAHLHRFIHQKPTPEVPFPLIVNSNNSVLQVEATEHQMKVKVVDVDGKQLDAFEIVK